MPTAQKIKDLISAFESDCAESLLPPEGGLEAIGQPVIPFTLVRSTRGYLEKITHQVNGSYTNGWYDACAVMIRRLIETLIIEAFESHSIANNIKSPSGDFLYLSDLISATLRETTWNLSRNSKQALPKLKDIGDKSAHSRRYNAVRDDIDKIISDLRVVVQELIYLSKLK
ncbi:hypothetical protein NK553_28250 [Pseudomonas sp. ZM23]|uniref:DUF4145 domain-containing protein n=1 Tax=Pseudomonas triclosanedens TaxID=2961893 RepID=A0ABY6ZWS3_9PSED|nr:hypothetical protein [Pseudomonas triclosanedens]MCP8467848.1 hypothetical protein [Pseudomonas triclosanedens]MCP8469949.1 hypothetical protein [Pseudomonas triclosanedens]MCP8477859.1 hypothetical protein [Pseudomonas triclosanedens]WAI49281.1 hypothetical protein OU419_26660 [Pseudomonas triclosanedens]